MPTEAKCGLEILAKSVVKEAGLDNFDIFVFVQEELGGLSTRVDDERVSLEPAQHYRVLHAEVVVGQ